MAYAGGTAAYAEIVHRYESSAFDRERSATAVLNTMERNVDLRDGDTMGRLEVPRIGISVMILHGTEDATLTLGAGHVPGTPSPGGNGNLVIAAHRDTFFRRLDRIRPGDRLRILTLGHTYDYVVKSTETVDPEDTRVMESHGRQELTLITCYPFYFVGAAPKRFIVHAQPLSDRSSSPEFFLPNTLWGGHNSTTMGYTRRGRN
jgi:sortase A